MIYGVFLVMMLPWSRGLVSALRYLPCEWGETPRLSHGSLRSSVIGDICLIKHYKVQRLFSPVFFIPFDGITISKQSARVPRCGSQLAQLRVSTCRATNGPSGLPHGLLY